MLDERKLTVLRAIVTDYVSSHEPVGSKALVERYQLGVSPATVRNDMAVLEDEGYIAQPHTSAGRVPTDKGYRMFVDQIGELKPLSPAERRAIETFMSGALDIDDIVARTVRLLASLTRQIAIVQYPIMSLATVHHVDFVPLAFGKVMLILVESSGRVDQQLLDLDAAEDALARWKQTIAELIVGEAPQAAADALAGAAQDFAPEDRAQVSVILDALHDLLSAPPDTRVAVGGVPNIARFADDFHTDLAPVLEALEEQVVLLKLLDEASAAGDLTVRIGQENPHSGLQTTSMVASTYGSVEEVWATLGIVGPTRMDYPSTMASVRAVARYVGRFLAQG